MTTTLKPELMQVLAAHRVEISEPRDQMVQLNAVRVGPQFTKPATNVLLVAHGQERGWQVYVDEDLAYLGDDPARGRLFTGQSKDRWQPLAPPGPLTGDVNLAVLRVLEWLDSPMRRIARRVTRVPRPPDPAATPLDPQLDRVGQVLGPEQLKAAAVQPTPGQAEVVDRVAELASGGLTPACPVIHGPAGSGKTALAATAACHLLDRGLIDQVFQMAGAAVAAGAVFWPQRDDRLRHILQVLPQMPRTLVLVEQFDLLVNNTEVTESLISDCLDRATPVIGVVRGEVTFEEIDLGETLQRRVYPFRLVEPDVDEMKALLAQRLENHPLAKHVEVAPGVVPAVLSLAALRPGANPGAAVGLLDAVLAHAQWTGVQLATPDDVFYLARPDRSGGP